ncbi:MFS transporter [Gluconacetobacter sp. Hr-1-5]|uniref:MFS transporter n=1 Tax=Gluconacetobacter sp. Hr-1-5 TaxID=3395370 RepID=UPI003B52FAB4
MAENTGHARAGVLIGAACAGNFLEFYNFMAYAFFAPMIGHAFFPSGSGNLMNLLYALMTFAVGFVMRPLGAVVIGRFARAHGQHAALMLTFGMMGFGSFLIAATPPAAAIGITAPIIIILARILQGFSDGGEVGPATELLYSAAPGGLGGVYSTLQYMTQLLGSLLAVLLGLVLSLGMSHDALFAWGWRVPFAFGLVIVPAGLFIRRLAAAGHAITPRRPATPPSPEERRAVRKVILFVFLGIVSGTVSTYLRTFGVSYAVSVLHLPPATGMAAMTAGLAAGSLSVLASMAFIARHPHPSGMVIFVTVLMGILSPFVYSYAIHDPGLASQLTLNVSMFALSGFVMTSLWKILLDALPPHSRSFLFGIIYALAVSIFGGLTQPAVTWLIAISGNPLIPGWMISATAALSLFSYLRLRTFMKN